MGKYKTSFEVKDAPNEAHFGYQEHYSETRNPTRAADPHARRAIVVCRTRRGGAGQGRGLPSLVISIILHNSEIVPHDNLKDRPPPP